MKKKLVSLLLILCMVLSLAPAAFAADGVRETDLLEDQTHADVDFADMEYTPVTEKEFLDAVENARSLLTGSSGSAAVEETFNKVADLFQTINSNLTLLGLLTSLDVTDDDAQDKYMAESELYVNIVDPFIYLIQDILKSPYSAFLRNQISQDDYDYYMSYGGTTDEQKALAVELQGIDELYWDAYYGDYTCAVGDEVWTSDAADEAYSAGTLSSDVYDQISTAIARDRNAAMGKVFMKALELNTKLAATYGYDNYAEYAYVEEYGRDYTAEDVLAFAEAVKEYIVPLGDNIYILYVDGVNSLDADAYYNFYSGDYTTDGTLSAIRPYIGKMSSELLEAWDYMIGHGLYDITYSGTKEDSGYTTIIPSYGAPFFFNQPYGYLADFSTIIHEFGHYNNFYYHPSGWNDGSSSIDVAEVHSQGLELLFTHFYKDVLGPNYKLAEDMLMYNLLYSAIVNGAMMGELELYAASTPDVTLKDINEKYRVLAGEYGLVEEDDPRTEMYGWIEIPHLTTSPMYYISYATSAAGAFTFWLEAQEDGFDAAVDHYLKFVSQSVYSPFLEQFESAGMDDPLSPDYIEELSETLYDTLGLEERLTEVYRKNYFADVNEDDWFFENVCLAYEADLMVGDGNGDFDPNGTATRAAAATVLWNLDGNTAAASSGKFTDVSGQWYAGAVNWAAEAGVVQGSYGLFNGDGNVTREEMAVMIYNYAKSQGLDMTVTASSLAFSDASEVHSWAAEAMTWCVENGIFQGSYGLLSPTRDINRAELAKVVVSAASLIASELEPDAETDAQ